MQIISELCLCDSLGAAALHPRLIPSSCFPPQSSLDPDSALFSDCLCVCRPPGNNTCFYGKCYYCRESEPACAEGETMEGSLTLWLPDVWPLQKHRHPWGRTYREGKLARWVSRCYPEKHLEFLN